MFMEYFCCNMRWAEMIPLIAMLLFLAYLENTCTGNPLRAEGSAAPVTLFDTVQVNYSVLKWAKHMELVHHSYSCIHDIKTAYLFG